MINEYTIKYKKRFRRKIVDLGKLPFKRVIICDNLIKIFDLTPGKRVTYLNKDKLWMFELRIVPSVERALVLKCILKSYLDMETNEGLCSAAAYAVDKGMITQDDADKFTDYLYKYKPSTGGIYFWPLNEIKTRIDWMKLHIKLNNQ